MTVGLLSFAAARIAAPSLTWTSADTDSTPDGVATFENFPLAGYIVTSQIQAAGGDWSSPVINNSRAITDDEDLINQIDFNNSPLAPGSYDWRIKIGNSNWSNVETKTLIAFSPSMISPSAWFEPRLGGLFQSNAGTTSASSNNHDVGFVPDQSGNSFTITSVSDDTTRPKLQGVGTTPYIDFDGTNDALRRSGVFGGTGTWAAGAGSWFVAIRAATPAAQVFMAGEYNSGSAMTYCPITSQSGGFTSISGFARNDSGSSVTGFFNNIIKSGAFDGSDHVIGVVDSGSTLTGYVDGVAGTPISYTRGANVLTPDSFFLGARAPSGTPAGWMAFRFYGGVFTTDVLTGPEVADLTTYLGTLQGRTI